MTMTNQPTLLPCPFCGGAGQICDMQEHGVISAECLDCLASTRLFYPLKEDPTPIVAEAWNRRAYAIPRGKREDFLYTIRRSITELENYKYIILPEKLEEIAAYLEKMPVEGLE